MYKELSRRVALILFLLLLSGCGSNERINDGNNIETTKKSGENYTEEDSIPEQDDGLKTDTIDFIAEEVTKMTLEEKIGQMLILGIEGYSLDDNSRVFINKHKIGGFILFGKNIKNSKQLLNLLNSLKLENSKNNIPLFLTIDEEGGRVTRMPQEIKRLPTNKVIGKIDNEDFSREVGFTIGEEISSFGFNMNFAPVLDINSNPKNPVIGDRSFGTSSALVSKLGIQTMLGLQAANVIPVVKHFPGHGDTSVDSHKGLPVIKHDLRRLESLELIPFKHAIENNAEAVMIAHILLTEFDKENPSSMSKFIITDLLREKLNFHGVVITDDMTMGAITKNYNLGEAAVKSVIAGTDIVLVCHDYEKELGVIEALVKAVSEGRISEQRINDSVSRILKLKRKYGLKDEIKEGIDVDKINNRIDTLLRQYNNIKNKKKESQ